MFPSKVCKICNSTTAHIREIKKNLDYYRCSSCGFIYLDDSYIVDKEIEKEHYDKHKNSVTTHLPKPGTKASALKTFCNSSITL